MPGHSRSAGHSSAPVGSLLREANGFYEKQQWQQGQNLLERAILLAPDSGDAWHLMAEGYYQLGQIEKAQHFARRADDYLPSDSGYRPRNYQLLNGKID